MARKGTPGITKRHSRSCRSTAGGNCNCDPTYVAWVYSKRDGKKLYKSFADFNAAKGWRTDATKAVRDKKMAAPTQTTFQDAAEDWLEKCKRGEVLTKNRRPYAAATLRGYDSAFRRFVFPDIGNRRLSDLTADDFQNIIDKLVGEGFSGQTVRNVIVPCQALYGRYRRQVMVKPTVDLDLPEPGGRRERADTPIQAATLLAALPTDIRAIYATCFYAGLRRGEIRALRVSNLRGIDGNGVASIHVRHGWDDVEGEAPTKSQAGVREVPIPETLRVILAEHLTATGRSGEDLVFGRTATLPFLPNRVAAKALQAWAIAAVGAFLSRTPLPAELVPITFHEARHSYSSYLDAAGVSEARADRYMGHSNRTVAARYRHQLDGQLAEDGRTLDKYLTAAASGKVVPLHAVEAVAS